MELTNQFLLPVPVATAWEILHDFPRVAIAMPGAKLISVDGDHIEGELLVKLGSMRVTYRGEADVIERDRELGRLVIEAKGRDDRGGSTAKARISTVLAMKGSATLVSLQSTVEVTGRPAQMGIGLIESVAQRVVNEFAARLAELLSTSPSSTEDGIEADSSDAGSSDTLNIGKLAARPILVRLLVLLLGAGLVILLLITTRMIWG